MIPFEKMACNFSWFACLRESSLLIALYFDFQFEEANRANTTVGELNISPHNNLLSYNQIPLLSMATSLKSMFVCLLSLLAAALSVLRISAIDSELDYYMAATKGTPFFPNKARLLLFGSPQNNFLLVSVFHINLSL
jgi:hypothetical protein